MVQKYRRSGLWTPQEDLSRNLSSGTKSRQFPDFTCIRTIATSHIHRGIRWDSSHPASQCRPTSGSPASGSKPRRPDLRPMEIRRGTRQGAERRISEIFGEDILRTNDLGLVGTTVVYISPPKNHAMGRRMVRYAHNRERERDESWVTWFR